MHRERPCRHGARRDGRDDQHRGSAQSQRDHAEPGEQPDRKRRERAAGVGEQQSQEEDPQRRVCHRAEQRVTPAPRPEPHASDRAHRRREARRVPVAVGLLDARVRVRASERAGEDLRQQRVAAHHHRCQRDPAEHGAPLPRGEAHEHDRRREHPRVREHPARVEPARVGLHRPHHRHAGEHRESDEQAEAPQAVARARARDHRRGDCDPGAERQHHLARRHRPEAQAALGEERDEADQAGNGERDEPLPARVGCAQAGWPLAGAPERRGHAQAPAHERALSRDGCHGNGCGGIPRRLPPGTRAGTPRSRAAGSAGC